MSKYINWTKEDLVKKMSELQSELAEVSKEHTKLGRVKLNLKDHLTMVYKQISFLDKTLNEKSPNTYITRDVDLVIDYLINNGRSGVKDIVNYINEQLEGKETRWKYRLDSSNWNTSMEVHLLKRNIVKKEKINNKIYFYI